MQPIKVTNMIESILFAISIWRKLFSYTQLKLHGCHISLLPPRDNRISSATLAFNQILLLLLLYFNQAIQITG